MSYFTKDGTEIFYKDQSQGRPVVFSHGWPLSSDAWEPQMVFLGERGYRVIAHDRRSHGRSAQVWEGNNMDQYADDLAELIDKLDLKDAVLVGHSTGGGEVTRYLARHGSARVSKAVLLGAVPPLMLQTKSNPVGLPISVFDDIRKNTNNNRSQFFKDLTIPFYGFNRADAKVSQGLTDDFWRQGMMGGLKGQLDSIKAFSESDFTEDLKSISIPVWVAHGDDDQIVPLELSGALSAKLLPHATLKVYAGGSHGLAATQQDEFNADLLAFIEQ